MFCEPWLEFLKGLRLPEFSLVRIGPDIKLEFLGKWSEAIYWETIALSIVNELYARRIMKDFTSFGRDLVEAHGRVKLAEKIETLAENPGIIFSDFGTRRRFSGGWQDYVGQVLKRELPEQFLGSSNTFLAMKNGTVPMGTAAHELFMVVAGLRDGSSGWLAASQKEVLDGWWQEFGWGLSIFLPDTFGTDFFLRNLTAKQLAEWKGFRWDSGDPFEFGDKITALYQTFGINPKTKLLIPSDGLDIDAILKLHNYFGARIKMSYGWGTNLTNDLFPANVWDHGLWYGPLSLVIKPALADGHHLVKLSDNLAKATGDAKTVERYKREAGYTNTESVTCTY